MKKMGKHKRCEECGFWFKVGNLVGGICVKCNTTLAAKKDLVLQDGIEQAVAAFWDTPPMPPHTPWKATGAGKSAAWQAVEEVFQAKMAGWVPKAKSLYHCATCGKGLTWAEMKASALGICSACMIQPLGTEQPPTEAELEAAPIAQVPSVLAKEAKQKIESVVGDIESKVSDSETSPVLVQEPLKGKLEKGEPVVMFQPTVLPEPSQAPPAPGWVP